MNGLPSKCYPRDGRVKGAQKNAIWDPYSKISSSSSADGFEEVLKISKENEGTIFISISANTIVNTGQSRLTGRLCKLLIGVCTLDDSLLPLHNSIHKVCIVYFLCPVKCVNLLKIFTLLYFYLRRQFSLAIPTCPVK